MDLWDAALLWFWFYNACRLAGPLWILSDSGPTEFSFPWNWKRVAVPVFGVMFDVALLLFFLRGVFDGNPTFNLKLVFFGSTLSFRAFRDVMESVVTVTTSGVRVGVRFYSWPELGPFRWLPSAGFGTPALQIQAPSAPGKEVRIRSAEDPAVEAVLLSHGLVKS